MNCDIMWQKYQKEITIKSIIEKNLKMRVYRSIYIFKFFVEKNKCDKK